MPQRRQEQTAERKKEQREGREREEQEEINTETVDHENRTPGSRWAEG